MKISDLVRLSTDNLRRRKGRTALTVIGVVVGTCAIVLMISLGIAINKQNEEMLQSWGDLTQIQIYNYSWHGSDGSSGQEQTLNDETIAQLKANDHVVAVTPYYQPNSFNGYIYAGKKDRYMTYAWNLYGMYVDALEPMGFQLKSGRYLTGEETLGKNKIPVLVGENFGYNFEDTRRKHDSPKRYRYQGQTDAAGNLLEPFVDVENDKLTLKIMTYGDNGEEVAATYELVVEGVMVSDYSKHYCTDSGIVMRIEDMKKLEAAYRKASGEKGEATSNYQEVYVKCDTVDQVEKVEAWIHELGFTDTYSMTQVRQSMQESVAQSQMILGGLAAISLFVAALNIMNTMTMAIYERTREIGVMKVLGCGLGTIRAMFLIESGAIGFLGGLIGVAVSLLISAFLNNINTIMAWFGNTVDLSWITSAMGGGYGGSGDISIIPPWLVLLALTFATVVGLLSGIAPAGRAVKISALEAIRHE